MKHRRFRVTALSQKIAVTYGLLFASVLLAMGGVAYFGVKNYLVRRDIERLNDLAQATVFRILEDTNEHVPIDGEDIIGDARQDKTVNIRVYDPSGTLTIDSGNFALPTYRPDGQTDVLLQYGLFYLKTVDAVKDGKVIAAVQAAVDTQASHAFLETLFRWMAIADILGIAFSLFAGWLVSKRMLTPINRLIRQAGDIGYSDLSKRIEVPPSNDELSLLASTFNEMLGRIQESFLKQGRFTSDASHELRTPLTVIQGYAQMMDRWGKYDPAILQEGIDAIRSETHNMAYIMDRLLFLARGDSGSQIAEKENFDVGEMIDEIEKETSLIAPERRTVFHCEGGLELYADRKLIKQMLRAILDNSIKYTPQGGRVELDCLKRGGELIFRVSDTGIGIPQEDQEHVFERFYRVDKARERRNGGSGLGLSIVQWIVQAHEGRIDLSSTEGEGTIVAVTFPILSKTKKIR